MKHIAPVAILAMTLFVGPAAADQLLMERAQASAATGPQRGQSMETVEARYGAPEQRKPAVGEPPITRWQYPEFTVYFEGDRVIHSVATR